jgi:hypothetical protein
MADVCDIFFISTTFKKVFRAHYLQCKWLGHLKGVAPETAGTHVTQSPWYLWRLPALMPSFEGVVSLLDLVLHGLRKLSNMSTLTPT